MNKVISDYLKIDNYDIFDLMELSKIPESSRQAMFIDMNAIVWERFAGEKLGTILTLRQSEIVRDMFSEGKKFTEVLAYLSKEIPSFNELLADFTREQKVEFVRTHYRYMLEEYTTQFKIAKTDKAREMIKKQLELYTKAMELSYQNKWDLVAKLFEQ
jgi:hypothetical protein